MAGVEDVPGPTAIRGQHRVDPGRDERPGGGQPRRIQVALDGHRTQARARRCQRLGGVNRHDVGVHRQRLKQVRAHGREMDDRCAHITDSPQDATGPRGDQSLIVGRRQRARPGVEDLDDLGTGPHLLRDVIDGHRGDPIQQRAPDGGLRERQSARGEVIPRWPALDQVRRDRERPTGEADERGAILEGRSGQTDRLSDESKVGRHVDIAQALHVCHRPDRSLDERSLRRQREVNAHRLHGQHHVREQDRAVRLEDLRGADRHLRAQGRRARDLHHAVVLSKREVARQ